MIGIRNFSKDQPAKIIAEIGQAHEGSLGMLHSYIDALAPTGVHAVKFQVHIADAESSKDEPFRVHFSLQDQTRYDYWKRMEFSKQDWATVKRHCGDVGLEFIATPFSVAATRLLSDIGCETFKVGSGDVTNRLLLNTIKEVAEEVIVSSGLSTDLELWAALELFGEAEVPLAVLKCTTMYPTPPSEIDLLGLRRMINDLPCPVGFSDHSGKVFSGIAAMVLGASIIESHVVFDRRMFGPDTSSSLTVEELRILVEASDFLHQANRPCSDRLEDPTWIRMREVFGRTLTLRESLKRGDRLSVDHLECTKPAGMGIAVNDFELTLGKTLRGPKSKGEFLRWEDLDHDERL